jgi:ribonuclease T
MKTECYFSVDIESAGPIPGKYSMLSLGACVVGRPTDGFYVELKPVTSNFVAEALRVSGFHLAELEKTGKAPDVAMKEFALWVNKMADGAKPIFVGFNASFDWQFTNWYFESFTGGNPFGFGAIDIKSFYMGLRGVLWSQTTSSQLPAEFQPDTTATHNALDDAKAQGSIFAKLLKAHRG